MKRACKPLILKSAGGLSLFVIKIGRTFKVSPKKAPGYIASLLRRNISDFFFSLVTRSTVIKFPESKKFSCHATATNTEVTEPQNNANGLEKNTGTMPENPTQLGALRAANATLTRQLSEADSLAMES